MSVISNIKFFASNGAGKQKAKVYFTVGGVVTVSGAIVEGSNGLFVSLPRHKYTDKTTNEEKWADDVKWVDKEVGNTLQKEILAAYNNGGTSASTGTPAATTKAPVKGNNRNTPF